MAEGDRISTSKNSTNIISAHKLNFPSHLDVQPSTFIRSFANQEDRPGYVQDISNFGIAGKIWEGAQFILEYLLPSSSQYEPPNDLLANPDSPKVIIELGSGTGIVGLELSRVLRDCHRIYLTDLEEVCPLLETNRQRAGAGKNVQARKLGWGDAGECNALLEEVNEFGGVTHIVCSDVVYFPQLLPLLLRTLIWLTDQEKGNPNAWIVISYKVRDLFKESPFWFAFGAWFTFEPVCTSEGRVGEGEYFIFIAHRKPSTLNLPITPSLMQTGDSTFETLLYMGMDA